MYFLSTTKDAYMLWLGLCLTTSIVLCANGTEILTAIPSLLISLYLSYKSLSRRFSHMISALTTLSTIIAAPILYTKSTPSAKVQDFSNAALKIYDIVPTNQQNRFIIRGTITNQSVKIGIQFSSTTIQELLTNKSVLLSGYFCNQYNGTLATISHIKQTEYKKRTIQSAIELWAYVRCKIRNNIKSTIQSIIPNRQNSELILSTMFGFKPSKNTSKMFLNAGISHLLVVSGFHFGCIFKLASTIGKLFFRNIQNMFSLICCLTYFCILGPTYPATRSFICCIISILSQTTHCSYNSAQSIGIALFTQLIIDPTCIHSVSFIMSYVSSLTIIICFKDLSNKLIFVNTLYQNKLVSKYIAFIVQNIALSLCVQLFMLPIEVSIWGHLHGMSIIANTFLTPLMPIIINLSVPSILISILYKEWSTTTMIPLIKLTDIFMFILKHLSHYCVPIDLSFISGLVCMYTPICMILTYSLATTGK